MKARPKPPIDPLRSAVVQSDLLNLFSNYIPLSCYLVPLGQDNDWYGLAPYPEGLHPFQFELYFGKKKQQDVYIKRCFQKAAKTRRAVLGCHQGLYDLFVPVIDQGKQVATVVSGSFLKTLPDESWLSDQWKNLSGRQPGANDLRVFDLRQGCFEHAGFKWRDGFGLHQASAQHGPTGPGRLPRRAVRRGGSPAQGKN